MSRLRHRTLPEPDDRAAKASTEEVGCTNGNVEADSGRLSNLLPNVGAHPRAPDGKASWRTSGATTG